MYNPARCIGEYDCIDICPEGAIKKHPSSNAVEIDRDACSSCLECAKVCFPEVIRIVGREITAGAVMEEMLLDRVFCRGAGGVTVSGGEPLFQRDFAISLLRLAAQYHLSTAVETNGNVDSQTFKEALPYIDHLLYDLKHMDKETHRRFTGIGNEKVLKNLSTAVRTIPDVTVRVPVVPGFNMNESDLFAIAEYAADIGVKKLHLLPCHTLGASKSEFLGQEHPYGDGYFKKD